MLQVKRKKFLFRAYLLAVGIQPETAAFEGVVDMEQGYIKAGEAGITSYLVFMQQAM